MSGSQPHPAPGLIAPGLVPTGEPVGRVRWLMVFLVFVVAAVSYLDRNNISIAASAIQADFGISNVQLGVVFSAFVLGYAFTQPLAGWIADRFGPWRVIAVGIVWWSVFTAATGLVPAGAAWSMALLIGVRLMLGIGESVIFPAGSRLIANWVPAPERGLANGIVFAGVGIGAGLAPPLITWLVVTYEWRSAFYVSAAIGLVVLAIWLSFVRDRPADHRSIGAAELAHIGVGRVVDPSVPPLPVGTILRQRPVVLLTLSYFAYGYVAYIFFTWFFRYLSSERGLDLKSSAIYGMLPFIAMAIASPLGGWLADRLTHRFGARIGRCWTASGSLVLAAVFVATATQASDARVAGLFLAGGAGALYLSQSAYWTLSAGLGGASAGTVSGMMNMGNQIGGVVTASLTPVLADRFGWTASFLVAATICLAGAIAWLFIDPSEQADPRTDAAVPDADPIGLDPRPARMERAR